MYDKIDLKIPRVASIYFKQFYIYALKIRTMTVMFQEQETDQETQVSAMRDQVRILVVRASLNNANVF